MTLGKTPHYTPAQATALVKKVFADRGQPGVTASTKLVDIGYVNEINLLRLLASINNAIQSPPHGKLQSTEVDNWQYVKDIIASVEKV